MKISGLVLILIALFLLTAVNLTVTDRTMAADTIRLGFVADISGVGAQFYKSQKNAMDLFIKETNAKGGVLGKKLELVVRDAQLKADIGANMARELILSEKCDFLIGPTSSAVALAITRVAQEFKKIVMFHTSNAEAITTTDFQPYMFQVVPNTGIEGRGMAEVLAKKPDTNYAYIGYDYAYGHDQYDAFSKRLAKLKPDAKILETVWVKVSETNYSPYIPTLMAKGPQRIFSSLWGGGLANFIKQAKPYGVFTKANLGSCFDLDMLRAAGKDMPEEMLGYSRCPFYAVDTPEMKDFVKKYEAEYKDPPADWGIMAYDGLTALVQALKEANSVDSEKVVKVLGGLKWKGLRGERYIRAEDHMANVGIYVGTTAKDPKYPNFLIMKNVTEVPAEKLWLSVAEIEKLRAGKK